MKRILLLGASLALTGCMTSSAGKTDVSKSPMPGPAAEAKVAEKLPIVTPESVTPQNFAAKVREFEEELTRDARRVDAARAVADAQR